MGWKGGWDFRKGEPFWVNEETGERVFEKPDPESSCVTFAADESSPSRPPPLPGSCSSVGVVRADVPDRGSAGSSVRPDGKPSPPPNKPRPPPNKPRPGQPPPPPVPSTLMRQPSQLSQSSRPSSQLSSQSSRQSSQPSSPAPPNMPRPGHPPPPPVPSVLSQLPQPSPPLGNERDSQQSGATARPSDQLPAAAPATSGQFPPPPPRQPKPPTPQELKKFGAPPPKGLAVQPPGAQQPVGLLPTAVARRGEADDAAWQRQPTPPTPLQAYRQALSEATPPCIPYLGVYLTDLTFLARSALLISMPTPHPKPSPPPCPNQDEGNPDRVKHRVGEGTGEDRELELINWGKHQNYAAIIEDIRFYQTTHYNLAHCEPLQSYLTEMMADTVLSVDEQYARSLEVEPRGQPSGTAGAAPAAASAKNGQTNKKRGSITGIGQTTNSSI